MNALVTTYERPASTMPAIQVMRWTVAALGVSRFLPAMAWLERGWLFRTQWLEHSVKWFAVVGLIGGLSMRVHALGGMLREEDVAPATLLSWASSTIALLAVLAWLVGRDLGLSATAVSLPLTVSAALGGVFWLSRARALGVRWRPTRISRSVVLQVAFFVLGICLLLPSTSAAGPLGVSATPPTAGGAFRQAAIDIEQFTSMTVYTGQKYASIFFTAFALVHLPWLLVDKMFAGTSDLRGYVGPLLRETTILSLFAALLTRGPEVSRAIIDVLRRMGLEISGGGDLTAQSTFDALVKLWSGETLKIALAESIFGTVFTMMCAVVLLCCICICVAQLWFEFECKVALDLATISLGAGGAPWTRWMSTNYFKLAFQCGLRLMVTFVLQGLLMRTLDNWKVRIELDQQISPELLLHMLGSILLLCLMMWRMHAWVSAITSGHLSPGLDAMAMVLPAGLMAGGAAAAMKSGMAKLNQLGKSGGSGAGAGAGKALGGSGAAGGGRGDGSDGGVGSDQSLAAPVPPAGRSAAQGASASFSPAAHGPSSASTRDASSEGADVPLQGSADGVVTQAAQSASAAPEGTAEAVTGAAQVEAEAAGAAGSSAGLEASDADPSRMPSPAQAAHGGSSAANPARRPHAATASAAAPAPGAMSSDASSQAQAATGQSGGNHSGRGPSAGSRGAALGSKSGSAGQHHASPGAGSNHGLQSVLDAIGAYQHEGTTGTIPLGGAAPSAGSAASGSHGASVGGGAADTLSAGAHAVQAGSADAVPGSAAPTPTGGKSGSAGSFQPSAAPASSSAAASSGRAALSSRSPLASSSAASVSASHAASGIASAEPASASALATSTSEPAPMSVSSASASAASADSAVASTSRAQQGARPRAARARREPATSNGTHVQTQSPGANDSDVDVESFPGVIHE